MKFKSKLIAAGLLALCGAVTADVRANSIILNDTVGVTANGNGTFTYSYSASVDLGNAVVAGDYFTIFDFQGFQGGTTPNSDWKVTSQLVGVTPPSYSVNPLQQPAVSDSPFLPNVTFTYIGASPIVADSSTLALGVFTATTSVGTSKFDKYVAQDHPLDGNGDPSLTPSANTGTTTVPFSPGGPTFAPTPAAASAGFGLMGILAAGRRRSKRS